MSAVERVRTVEPRATARAVGAGGLLPLLVHLRPHWQLVLSPIFLWGLLLAGGAFTPGVVLVFIAIHVFLYGGVTAYNSAYDRDTGPVSGLYRPPSVTPALLPFSLLVQFLGLVVVTLVDVRLALIYLGYATLSIAYSHPRFRWKGSPARSAFVIFVGQGVLAFLAGWIAAGASLGEVLSPPALLGLVGAAGTTLALFPLGHLFQLRDDSVRGDVTLAHALGEQGTFRFSQAVLLASGACIAAAIALHWQAAEALVVGSAFPFAALALEFWRRRFDSDATLATYRTTMAFQVTLAAGFAVFIGLKLL
ncbi:MAG: UbiA family prenyltransferase [Candidatus Limnocylindria bacterium]